jgi:hypothetical protein
MIDTAGGGSTFNFERGVVSGTQVQMSSSGFTASGTKGVAAMSATYSLL